MQSEPADVKQVSLLMELELAHSPALTLTPPDSEASSPSSSTASGGGVVPSASGEWRIGELRERDLAAVCAICKESFPLDYPESWFKEVVTGKYISFGLFQRGELTSLLVAEVKLLSQCDLEVRPP